MRRVPLLAFTALVYLFLFAPIALVIANALNADEQLVGWGGFTLRWFDQALANDVVTDGLKNSLMIACAATAISMVVGTLAAIGLRSGGRGVRLATNTTTYSRLVMPELVLAIGLLLAFRAVELPLGMVPVIIGHSAFYMAYVIIIVSARLARSDPHVVEAARDLGATPLRALVRVTLPQLTPAVLTAGLVVFAFSMDNVITSLFLSSGLNTLPLVVFSLIRTRITPEVNAIGVLLMALTAVTILVFLAVRIAYRAQVHRRRKALA